MIDLDKGGHMGEIVEHHNSGVDKSDFRKSHSYDHVVSPIRLTAGSGSKDNSDSKKENLLLKLQPLES